MKKTIIAGAASVALAAMPVVGVFAATSVQDKITVTVSDTCAFSRTAGEGEYNTTLLGGNVVENFGGSTFEVTCNIAAGESQDINVTAEFQDLSDGAGNSIPYAAVAPTADTSSWVAMKSNATTGASAIAASNGVLINGTATDEAGTLSANVRYSVGVEEDQAAGTYTGYATYTLAENN